MKTRSMLWLAGVAVLLGGCKPTGGGEAAWVTTTSAEGRFRADFPLQPHEQDQAVAAMGGAVLHALGVAVKDGPQFMVMWSDYPVAVMALTTPEKILLNIRNGYDGGGQKILADKETTVSGHAARELEADTPDGVTRLRVFMVDNRLYQVMTIVPAAQRGDARLQRFFDSFLLLP